LGEENKKGGQELEQTESFLYPGLLIWDGSFLRRLHPN